MKDKLLSPYAPIRYQDDEWWKMARAVAQLGLISFDGQVHPDLGTHIIKEYVEPSLYEILEDHKDDPDVGTMVALLSIKQLQMPQWVQLAAQYEVCGRQIFDLGEEVVELLEQTDLGDCTLEDWMPPYNAFYLRFGKRNGIDVTLRENITLHLDGAFIRVLPWDDDGGRCIEIGFTMVLPDGSGVASLGYFVEFLPIEQKMPIQKAMEIACARRLAEVAPDVGDDEAITRYKEYQRWEINNSIEVLNKAIALLVNSFFYIESISDKLKLEPGRDTPPLEVVRWAHSNEKQRQKAKSRLLSQGYTVVYSLGRELQQAHTGVTTSSSGKRAHWRRGHWRRIKYGSELALMKRSWIKPVMVNATRQHDDLPGHVYVVGTSEEGYHLH
jgi:hypothetical protein